MSKRNSEYARKPNDSYQSPDWCLQCVLHHIPYASKIWEPACGEGNLVRVLADHGFDVYATDIRDGEDFFSFDGNPKECDGIVCNPPYKDQDRFLAHALKLMAPSRGFVFLLLSSEFSYAKSRREFFVNCPIFELKIELTRRIVWFEPEDGKRAAPSENHAWYLWNWKFDGTVPELDWAL